MLAAGVLATGVWVATPACATGHYGSYGAQRDYRDFERVAYDNGYRDGRSHGEHDARDRRDFRVDRDGDYRHGDDGYRGEYGDREFYRQSFRRGYEAGYRDGYQRFARSYGYDSYDRPVPPAAVYPSVPGGAYHRGDGDGRSYSPAAQNGYRDGLDAGRKDARDHDPFDPSRAERYREGDHDYSRSYGPRDDYQREYRAAFERGYGEGYRGSR
jgi:hypothetical protein